MKPGNVIDYVHVKSNHPPSVTKAIGKGINHRLNANSSSKEMFDAAKGPYQDALVRSGHDHRSFFALSEDNLLFTAGPMFLSTLGGWLDWR